MNQINVAILAGGDSSEYDISIKTANEIYNLINKDNINANIVLVKGSKWTLQNKIFQDIPINKNDFTLSVNNYSRTEFDCVVIAIHGTPAEDGKLAAYFDLINIPYVSSGVFASTLSYHKFQCNNFLRSIGVLVPKSLFYNKREPIRQAYVASELTYPIFVKPNSGGSSFGISKVKNARGLKEATDLAYKECDEIILEETVHGIEVTCGLLKTNEKEIILPLTQIKHDKDFYDFHSKYNPEKKIERITPAPISEDIELECKMIASKIYDTLNCSGMVRIDFIIQGSRIFFLEMNTIPDMSKDSIVAEQATAFGMSLSDIIINLIEDAVHQKRIVTQNIPDTPEEKKIS